MHKKDEDILEQIKNYFGVGYITKHGKNTLQYRVKSIRDLKFIVDLAWDMNNNAKRRRVTKDEYLDLFINNIYNYIKT